MIRRWTVNHGARQAAAWPRTRPPAIMICLDT
jgi:hypothetical protein